MTIKEIIEQITEQKSYLLVKGIPFHDIKTIIFLCRKDFEEIKNNSFIKIEEGKIDSFYGQKCIITEEEKTIIYTGISN